jgi:malate synthase
MAAQIPIKNDPIANDAALAKVRADKEREAGDGHDGTWVAHPALVPVAQEIFDRLMPQANQHHVLPDVTEVTRDVLLQIPTGTITEAGLRGNIEVSLHYLAAWLNGQGCVPIHNLMEDAATAEIARAQIWQWRAHGATLVDGRIITDTLVEDFLKQEYQKLVVSTTLPQLPKAMSLFRQLTFSPTFYEFLTIPGYAEL